MSRTRSTLAVFVIAAAQLFWLAQGAMLGCSFNPGVLPVEDGEDHNNVYTCRCDCSTTIAQSVRVRAIFDDVEQALLGEDTDGPSDLDLGVVPVAVRFASLTIPPGALIQDAAIQFAADAAFLAPNDGVLDLNVFALAGPDVPSFGSNFTDVVTLPRTSASVGWIVPPWQLGQAGAAQRTPNLAALLNEVINTPGWKAGNAFAVVFAGSGGRREAESYDGNAGRAPLLEVTYVVSANQEFDTCMPASVNPNVPGNPPVPAHEVLQMDCQQRVEATIQELAATCQYPAQCECGALMDVSKFEAACNDPCSEVPLNADCSNFDPINNPPTATNGLTTQPVCVAARRATGGGGPAPLSAAAFGQVSECAVEGQATIMIGDETKITPTRGTVGFLGAPCPGAQCTVGVTYDFALDPITFQVRFASDPTFEDLASLGASSSGAAVVGPSGFGQLGALATASSLRGRRSDDVRAYLTTNPDPVGVFVNWDDRVCSLFGNVVGTADGEHAGTEELVGELTVQGEILNQPPAAVAGAAQDVECTSADGATVVLDGSGSSDPDDNLAMLAWTQDTRVGTPVGYGSQVEVALPLGAPTTYVLRALDTFGQSDEDSTTAEVVDTTAPTLALVATPAVLWPPNHKLVAVQIAITTSDVCDTEPTVRLVSISSSEGALADGSGHTSPDIDGAQFGTDDRDVLLRAERSGTGAGRTYTLVYEVEDASGNVTQKSTTVAAPRNQS